MKITGNVKHGNGIGHLYGMPTANLDITLLPSHIHHGVYGVKVYYQNNTYYGVCNIGNRPSVDNLQTIEVFILDFDLDIYGQEISIEPLYKIRDIQKFNGIEEVKKQVEKDSENLKKYIKDHRL